MDEIRGTLTIYVLVSFAPVEGNRNKVKPVPLEKFHDVTHAQAVGYFKDFKGMNQGMPGLSGEWVARIARGFV